jgi:cytochrome d ubiquinol oxidase subunit I
VTGGALTTLADLAPFLVAQAGDVSSSLGPSVAQPDLTEARQMQALSLGFHIILVCFGVAFPAMIVFTEWLWMRTGDPLYKAIAKRWSKVMIVLFAVGAVSGTILSFELGMLWPEWMAQFGDVFGVAFTFEGISFFVEAIFVAVYVYSWDKLPRHVHILTGIPIIITGMTGSFFVIAVNGWMNGPQGFEVVNGEIVDIDPWAALFNDTLWHTLVHMLLAGYMVVGFLVAGVYAIAWLRGRRDRHRRTAFVIAFTFAAVATPIQLVVGDWAARYVTKEQPIKLASMEGLGETTTGAPWTFGGWYSDGEVHGGIEIPYLLSILADHDPNGTVIGLDTVPVEDQPPINIVRFAFQAMVGIATLLAALAAFYLVLWLWKRRIPRSRLFWISAVAAGPLSVVALISGWIVTEVGRQPWIVYEVFRTSQAVTAADGVPIGYGVIAAVYAALFVGTVVAIRVLTRRPIEEEVKGREREDLRNELVGGEA